MGETLLIQNIGLLQTPVGSDRHCGARQAENRRLKNASVLCRDGRIAAIAEEDKVFSENIVLRSRGFRLLADRVLEQKVTAYAGGRGRA